MREHIQVNVQTGKRTVIPYTQAQNDAADIAKAAEVIVQDARRLVTMKAEAVQGELEKLVNVDAGTSKAALDYQAEKRRQGV